MEFVKGIRKVKGERTNEKKFNKKKEKRERNNCKLNDEAEEEEEGNSWSSLAHTLTAHVLYSDIRHWFVLHRRQQQYHRSQQQHRMFGISYLHIAEMLEKYHSIRLLTPMTSTYYGITDFDDDNDEQKELRRRILWMNGAHAVESPLFHSNGIRADFLALYDWRESRNLFRITMEVWKYFSAAKWTWK